MGIRLGRIRALFGRRPKAVSPAVSRNRFRIVVVANCQHRPLTQIARMCIGSSDTEVLGLSHLELKDDPNHCARTLDSADVVIAQPLSAAFGEFSAASLKERLGDRCVIVPNLFFYGYHPEITYSGSEGRRVVSPLGDYHSAAAVICHQQGLSDNDAVRLLQSEAFFVGAGLDAVADHSLQTLREREQACEVVISDYIAERYKSSLLFYTVNHPCAQLVQELVLRVLARIEIPSRRMDPQILRSPLRDGPVYPIHQAYAELMGFSFRQPFCVKGLGGGGDSLTLEQFIRESYAIYWELGGELEVRSPYGRWIREYVGSLGS